jgi:hypothetical protein
MPAVVTNSIGAARWLTSMSHSALYRTSLGTDLRPLSALLWQQRIAHRIAEESGEQVLRLANEEQRAQAKALLDQE